MHYKHTQRLTKCRLLESKTGKPIPLSIKTDRKSTHLALQITGRSENQQNNEIILGFNTNVTNQIALSLHHVLFMVATRHTPRARLAFCKLLLVPLHWQYCWPALYQCSYVCILTDSQSSTKLNAMRLQHD